MNDKENKNNGSDQISLEEQKEIIAMMGEKPIEVEILRTKKRYTIDWLKNAQMTKLASLLIQKKHGGKNETNEGSDTFKAILDDNKLACKVASIYILNGFWKIRFRYWMLWRWFYYIRQYETSQLMPLLLAGRERIPFEQYLFATSIQASAKEILTQMTMQQIEEKLREFPRNEGSQDQGHGDDDSGEKKAE